MKKNVLTKVARVGAGLGALTMGIYATKRLLKKLEKDEVDKEDVLSNQVLDNLRDINMLKKHTIKYVNDSGYTPIYTYSRFLDPEKLQIPDGYVLLKVNAGKKDGGSYAIAELDKKEKLRTNYHVLFYLVDESEWEDAKSDDIDEIFVEDLDDEEDYGPSR